MMTVRLRDLAAHLGSGATTWRRCRSCFRCDTQLDLGPPPAISSWLSVVPRARDGHDHMLRRHFSGAVAVIRRGVRCCTGSVCPISRSLTRALRRAAAVLNDHLSAKLKMIGTGTKGRQRPWPHPPPHSYCRPRRIALNACYKLEDDTLHQFPAHFTTPEAPQVQETLARIVDQGCTHAVVEASSEALAQHRLRGTRFDVAVWTNLAPEHLNFHGDMEGYFEAKRILFEASDFAVVNRRDPWGMRLVNRDHTTYADKDGLEADWWAGDIIEDGEGLSFSVHHPQGRFAATLPMIGTYNVANAMAAIAAVDHLGIAPPDIQRGLASFPGVPGRMQVLQTTPVRVVLDFAHTPDSLRVALSTLRQTTARRLIVVLGSAGGPRDPSKRAPLGEVAATLADLAIFTEEDCRDTPIYDILNEMKRGADEVGRANYILEPDRLQAIAYALSRTEPGDTAVFCGKAGEITLERATETLPWIEETIVRSAMADLGW